MIISRTTKSLGSEVTPVHRRELLAGVAGASVLVIAGCSDAEGQDDPGGATVETTTTATAGSGTGTPTRTESRTGTQRATDTGTETPSTASDTPPETRTDTRTEAASDTRTATASDTPTEDPADASTATHSDTETGTETETATATRTTETDTATPARTTESGGGGSTTTVIVAPDGNLEFSPDSVTISVGDTVRWEWADDDHNIKPSVTADESGWEGTPGDRGPLYDTGYVHEHTFEVTGEFPYECVPHGPHGMRGEVVVVE